MTMNEEKEAGVSGQTEGKESVREPWGGTTDPQNHDPNKYRYLVLSCHSLKPSRDLLSDADYRRLLNYRVPYRSTYESEDWFEKPEEIGDEKSPLWLFLIDSEHPPPWMMDEESTPSLGGGLIVEVLPENIVRTSATVGPYKTQASLEKEEKNPNRQILSGDELLKNTPSGKYNEVVAWATKEGVTLRGFYYLVDEDGKPLDPVLAEKIEQHAKRLNLPVIKISDEQEECKIDKGNIQFKYKGKTYNLGPTGPLDSSKLDDFYAYNERGEPFFPSPEKIDEIIAHLMQQGVINEEQAQQIRENYKSADIRRRLPRVERDEEGRIKRVTIRDGYGEEEKEYYINDTTGASVLYLRRKTPGDIYKYPPYQRQWIIGHPIFYSEALDLLKKIREIINDDEYKELLNFVKRVKGRIDNPPVYR